MSTDVHPVPPAGPALIPAGTAGAPVAIGEHSTVDPVTGRTVMHLRIVQLDDGSPALLPGIRLGAGTGAPVEVTNVPTTIGGASAPAAIATVVDEPDGIRFVELEILRRPPGWTVQIVNTDTRDHRYVWTVAGTADGTRRPWLDIPGQLQLDARTGDTGIEREASVANHGPGPLTLTDPDGTDLGSGFVLSTVTPRTVPPNGRAVAVVAFTPPSAGGDVSVTWVLGSDDPLAGPSTGHDDRLQLTAVVRSPPPTPTVVVPDVLDTDESTARATLDGLGLVTVTVVQAVPGLLPRTVGFQDPGPGSVVPAGATVTLTVAP